MKLTFHGAAGEVGRSCIEVQTEEAKVLMDCGLKLTEHGSEYPVGFNSLADIDAVLLSHAHLDHSGALPIFDHNGMHCPIFATSMTKKIARILLEDSFKIGRLEHHAVGYSEDDILEALSFMERVKLDSEGKVKDLHFKFFDAGHIPGSSLVFLDDGDKTLLYTGDINTVETQLLYPARQEFPEVDVFITECTYGDRDHPPRRQVENQFLKKVESVVKSGGSCIIPVFAVGRAQEILLLVSEKNFGVPIYMDGMGVKVTELFLSEPSSVKSPDKLKAAYAAARKVKGYRERRNVVKEQGIFITTSGMLTGGPVVEYIKHMHRDERNAIILTGFQGEQTNGRLLMEKGQVYVDGWKTHVKCQVEQFDFSAHAGLSELKKLVKRVNPQKLVLQHGDPPAIAHMADWAMSMGYDTVVPKLGETIEV